MKTKYVLWITAILILLTALLTGCGNELPPASDIPPSTDQSGITYSYSSVAVRDYEPCYEMKMPTYMKTAEIDGNTYQFHPDVTEEDRTRFIESQCEMLSLIGEKRGKAVEGYTFRVFNIYYSRSDSEEQTAYYGLDDLDTWKQTLATVQMLYGEYTTYGYMYAMADSLAGELGWKTAVKTASKNSRIFSEMPDLLTLTYPCFISRYSTNTQTNAAVTLSLDVFGKMDDPYSGESEFIEGVKEYAAANGLEYPEYDFRFSSGSEYCVMEIETYCIDIVIDNTFAYDYYYSGSNYAYDNWEDSVATMYDKLAETDKQLKSIRQKLGGEPPERMILRLSHGGDLYSFEEFSEYTYATNDNVPYCMLSPSINTATEIYARYIMESVADADCYNGWYHVLLYYYLAREEISAAYREAMLPEEKAQIEYYTGHSIDSLDGMIKFYESVIFNGYDGTDETLPRYWIASEIIYWEAIAFADYIVREYGEENFIGLMLHPSQYMEYVRKQPYEVLLEWEDYLLENGAKLYPAVVDSYLVYLPTTTSLLWADGYKEIKNGGNTYRFDSSFSAEDRSAIVQKHNELLEYISNELGTKISGLTVNVTVESDARSHSDTGLTFFGKDDVGTWKQVFAALGTIYGDYTNYGYLYSLADHIAAELGWERDSTGVKNTAVFTDNPMLLSLTSPCFHPQYSTEEEISTAKALSIEILGKMSSPFGGESEFIKLANEYAGGLNVGYTPTYLRFAYNGRTCPVKVMTNNLEIFIDSTYIYDYCYLSGYTDENWLESITSMTALIEEKDSELTEANKFFGYTPEFLLTTWLRSEVINSYSDGYSESVYGLYSNNYVYTELQRVDSLLHEYVHHIDNMIGYYCPEEDWTCEALAYYYAREDAFDDFVQTRTAEDEQFFKYYQGTPVDTVDAFVDSRDLVIYSWSYEYLPESNLYTEYSQGSNTISIAAYIVRNWGEDAFYAVMLDPYSAESILGKPLSEITADWSNYIMKEIPEIYPKLKEY